MNKLAMFMLANSGGGGNGISEEQLAISNASGLTVYVDIYLQKVNNYNFIGNVYEKYFTPIVTMSNYADGKLTISNGIHLEDSDDYYSFNGQLPCTYSINNGNPKIGIIEFNSESMYLIPSETITSLDGGIKINFSGTFKMFRNVAPVG